jgi:hypothetical protein
MVVYIMGSMRNPRVPETAIALRAAGYEAFEEWFAPGSQADEEWQKYEKQRGRTYKEALSGYHAKHVFEFDLFHLDRADMGVLVLPAGKSAHIELGYLSKTKPTFVLFDEEPERYDIMYQFATAICFSLGELVQELDAVRRGTERVKEQVRASRLAPWNGDR